MDSHNRTEELRTELARLEEKHRLLEREAADVLEIIRFTENLSAKIHGLLDEETIFSTIKEEFGRSTDYDVSVLLLSADGKSLQNAGYTSKASNKQVGLLERMIGKRGEDYTFALERSPTYRSVVQEGRTVQVKTPDLIGELFPRVVARLVIKYFRYEGSYGIIAPLRKGDRIVGTFGMTSVSFPRDFVPSVNNLARHISTALEIADYVKERSRAEAQLVAAHERLSSELEAAAVVQRSLLPSLPDLPGVRIAFRFEPSEELGGDILNAFRIGEGHIGVFVIDVSGHGVGASLLSVALNQILLPAFSERFCPGPIGLGSTSPKAVAERLNQQFRLDSGAGQYFTLIYGILDTESGEFCYVSTGHPGPIQISADGHGRLLTTPGYPVGFVEDPQYEERRIMLGPGDRLYLYSDGITEALRSQHGIQAEHRLVEALELHRKDDLEQSVSYVASLAKGIAAEAEIEDDVTVLGLEVVGKEGEISDGDS